MELTALNCPNCAAPYNPQISNICSYCECYIVISSNNKEDDYDPRIFETQVPNSDNEIKGIFVAGILLLPGEIPIRSGAGVIVVNPFFSESGSLVLTNRRLLYKSLKDNKRNFEIQLSDILYVKKGFTWAPYQPIKIFTKDGAKQKVWGYFVRNWIKKINETIKQ